MGKQQDKLALFGSQLAAMFANMAQAFTPFNPGQQQLATGIQDSARGSIAAQNAYMQAKRDKKKKNEPWGDVLRVAGYAAAPVTEGWSIPISNAGASAVEGGSVGDIAPQMGMDLLYHGATNYGKSTPSSPTPDLPDVDTGFKPGASPGSNLGKARPSSEMLDKSRPRRRQRRQRRQRRRNQQVPTKPMNPLVPNQPLHPGTGGGQQGYWSKQRRYLQQRYNPVGYVLVTQRHQMLQRLDDGSYWYGG